MCSGTCFTPIRSSSAGMSPVSATGAHSSHIASVSDVAGGVRYTA